MLKTEKTHDVNQMSDGWIVTNPNAVGIDNPHAYLLVLYDTLQNPSSIRVDRLEWPSGDKKACYTHHCIWLHT